MHTNYEHSEIRKCYYPEGANITIICEDHLSGEGECEWHRNDHILEGKNKSVLELHPCEDEGVYHVITNRHHDHDDHKVCLKQLSKSKCGKGFCPSLELIIQFKPETSDDLKEMLRNHFNARKSSKICPNTDIELWEWEHENEEGFIHAKKELVNKNEHDDLIVLAEENFIRPVSAIEDGDHSSGKPHLHGPDSNFPGNLEVMLKAQKARNHYPSSNYELPEFDKKNVLVAILDTGIHYDNITKKNSPILKNIAHKLMFDNDGIYGYNFVDNNRLPFDDNGHGTEMAHIILGEKYNEKSNIKILPVKTHDQYGIGSLYDCICGIYYAIKKQADIINISWGYGGENVNNTEFLKEAIKEAKDKGVLIVASAGNYGHNNDEHPHYPSSFSIKFDNVISVAALDQDDQLLSFKNKIFNKHAGNHAHGSSWGEKSVQIAARGYDYHSVYSSPVRKGALLNGTSYATAKVTNAIANDLGEKPRPLAFSPKFPKGPSLKPASRRDKFLKNPEKVEVIEVTVEGSRTFLNRIINGKMQGVQIKKLSQNEEDNPQA